LFAVVWTNELDICYLIEGQKATSKKYNFADTEKCSFTQTTDNYIEKKFTKRNLQH